MIKPNMVIDLTLSSHKSRMDRTWTMNCFLNDIRKGEVLERDEEVSLCRLAKDGDKEAIEKLVKAHQSFVYAVAKRLAGSSDCVMDLVNEGNIGLLESIKYYDPDSGNRFLSYAVWMIRRKMIEFLNYNHTVKDMNDIRIGHKIYAIKNAFLLKNHRDATNEEIAEGLKKEYDIDIKDLSSLNGTKCCSTSTKFGDEDDEFLLGDSKIFNERTCSYNDYEEEIERESKRAQTYDLMDCLMPKEKEVILSVFGIGRKEESMDEIAKRMGVCKERVRQMRQSALDKMLKYGEQKANKKRLPCGSL